MGIFTRTSEPLDDGTPDLGSQFEALNYQQGRSLPAQRGITASAARIDLKSKREIEAITKRRAVEKWQNEAWDYFDLVGEIKFAANIIANVMSRVNIYAAYNADSSQVPARVHMIDTLEDDFKEKANSALYLLESSNGGTGGLLRAAALNLFVVGECYLVREPAKPSTHEPEKWQIRSIDEIVPIPVKKKTVDSPSHTFAIKTARTTVAKDYIHLPPGSYMARFWRNHPRFSDEADSSMRGVLDLCDELLLLSRTASAAAKSKLNAGLLFVPDGLSHAGQAPTEMLAEGEEGVEEEDSFEMELQDSMVTPIADPGSAASIVPLLVRGPADLGQYISLLKFERSFDPALAERAEAVMNRIISGLDIPREIVGGMSNLKGANAKILEESLYTSHIEPMILMLCDCLTVAFLRPALRALGFAEEDIIRTVVWYDPSAITSKPSKSESATVGYEKQIISADAWRRTHGFSVTDAPTQLEVAQRLAVAKGLISEPLAEKLISTLIPDLMSDLRKEQLQQSDPTSANALNNALDGEEAPPVPEAESASTPPQGGTIDTSSPTPPPTLLEP